MKTILLLVIILIPITALAGVRNFGHSYSGHHGGYSTGPVHMEGYTRSNGTYASSYYRSRPSHQYGASSPAFDYSVYPTDSYSPDPPGFQYHSITPTATPEGVYTWTDSSGTVHFTDEPPPWQR
jgi:hypothetical protein